MNNQRRIHIDKNETCFQGGALITDEQKKLAQRYAVFAESAYYPNVSDVRKILDAYNKKAWEVVPKTTPDATTFKSKETGKVIISIRGTDIKNLSDLATDLSLIAGLSRFTPRAKSITEVVQYAIDNYGKENIEAIVGHSLGGELARQMANKFGLKAYIFNRAAGPLDYFNVKNKDIKDFTTNLDKSYDPVSFLGTKQQKHDHAEFQQLKGKDPHTLQNFLAQTQDEIDQTGTGERFHPFNFHF